MKNNQKFWIIITIFVLIWLLILLISMWSGFIREGQIKEEAEKKLFVRCIAGCRGGEECSLRISIAAKDTSKDAIFRDIVKAAGLNVDRYDRISEEEILQEVERCKELYPDFDKSLYPYTELRN